MSKSSFRYHGRLNGCPGWLAKMCPDKSPPRTRIVVSNTCGFVLTSNETQEMTSLTAASKPGRSPRTTKVSRTSMRVSEKLPTTSLMAIFFLTLDASFRLGFRYGRFLLTGFPNQALARNMKAGSTGLRVSVSLHRGEGSTTHLVHGERCTKR